MCLTMKTIILFGFLGCQIAQSSVLNRRGFLGRYDSFEDEDIFDDTLEVLRGGMRDRNIDSVIEEIRHGLRDVPNLHQDFSKCMNKPIPGSDEYECVPYEQYSRIRNYNGTYTECVNPYVCVVNGNCQTRDSTRKLECSEQPREVNVGCHCIAYLTAHKLYEFSNDRVCQEVNL